MPKARGVTCEVEPADRRDHDGVGAVLGRFGTPVRARPGAVAVRLRGAVDQLPEIVRALDAESLAVADFRLHAPTLDDVFLAKTGRKLESAEAEPETVPA
jgi:ABC-2 type transport system ATP-binding protein